MNFDYDILSKKSVIKILGLWALGWLWPEAIVDWATQGLLDGLDTTNLRILAGLTEPFDWSEVEWYFHKAIKDLNIKVPPLSVCQWDYIRLLASEIARIEKDNPYFRDVLLELYHIGDFSRSYTKGLGSRLCCKDERLAIWYYIYLAWDGLPYGTSCYYLKGATEENILELTKKEANRFLLETKNTQLLPQLSCPEGDQIIKFVS